MIAEAKARALIEAARARGLRIATAESCTGGLVSAAITDVAGASDVFDRGFVSYSYPAKVAMLGVTQMLLTEHGAVSEAVARAIVYQQLSGKAAGTIHRRFHALYGDRAPEPAELLATGDEALHAAGLSRQKIAYLRDLARHVADGALPLDRVETLGDDAVIAALTAVKGVGRWTAQMFLMFRLLRPDVMPVFVDQATTIEPSDVKQLTSPYLAEITVAMQDELEAAFTQGKSVDDTLSALDEAVGQATD